MTTVVHVNDVDFTDPDVVYIGRSVARRGIASSKWGNPFPLVPNASGDERKRVLREYLGHIIYPQARLAEALRTGDDRVLFDHVAELRGKRLACWCKGKKDPRCHGDILAALADGATVDQVRDMIERGLERPEGM